MYSNIGRKIKVLAIILFALISFAAIICGIAVSIEADGLSGLLVIVAGPIVGWVLSWLVFGFGEIITLLKENRDELRVLSDSYRRNNYQPAPPLSSRNSSASSKKYNELQNHFNGAPTYLSNAEQEKAYPLDEEENKRLLEEDRKRQDKINKELYNKATPVKVNRFGEGTCPKCNNTVICSSTAFAYTCNKCKTLVKVAVEDPNDVKAKALMQAEEEKRKEEENKRLLEEDRKRQDKINEELYNNAVPVNVNRFGEAICPKCSSTIDCNTSSKTYLCKKCKTIIKPIK